VRILRAALVALALALAAGAPASGLDMPAEVPEVAALRGLVDQNPHAIKEAFKLGLLLAKDRRYDESILTWRALLRNNPGLPERARVRVYYVIGMAFHRSGRSKRAEPILMRCLEMAPGTPKIVAALEEVRRALQAGPSGGSTGPGTGGVSTGSTGATTATTISGSPAPPPPCPDGGKKAFIDGEAGFRQVLVLIDQAQDYDKPLSETIASLRTAHRCGHRPSRTRYLLGSALLRRDDKGDPEEAAGLLEASVKLDEDANTYLELGAARGLMNDTNAEIAALEKSIAILPDFAEAHFRLSFAYDKSKRPDAARHTFEHAKLAIRLNPRDTERFPHGLKHSEVARMIAGVVTDIVRRSEEGDLTDEDIDKFAKEFERMLGPGVGPALKEDVKKMLQSPRTSEFLKKLSPEERKRLMDTPEGQKELYEKLLNMGITPKR
jgi:tetratricopeptide (TPR) repeat protein